MNQDCNRELEAKYAAESRTEQTHFVMPAHLNGAGRLFGGQLALWIDEVAAIVAQRHSHQSVTTAAIDSLRFREAVLPNTLVVLEGRITYVGSTSMEVRVDSFVEDLTGRRRLINTAFVIEVAIDQEGHACPVPGLLFSTPFEEQEFEAGKKRRQIRTSLNKELYD